MDGYVEKVRARVAELQGSEYQGDLTEREFCTYCCELACIIETHESLMSIAGNFAFTDAPVRSMDSMRNQAMRAALESSYQRQVGR